MTTLLPWAPNPVLKAYRELGKLMDVVREDEKGIVDTSIFRSSSKKRVNRNGAHPITLSEAWAMETETKRSLIEHLSRGRISVPRTVHDEYRRHHHRVSKRDCPREALRFWWQEDERFCNGVYTEENSDEGLAHENFGEFIVASDRLCQALESASTEVYFGRHISSFARAYHTIVDLFSTDEQSKRRISGDAAIVASAIVTAEVYPVHFITGDKGQIDMIERADEIAKLAYPIVTTYDNPSHLWTKRRTPALT